MALGTIAVCLLLAVVVVLIADWGELGAFSLLKIVELGLFGFLTLIWLIGSWERWRELREKKAEQGIGAELGMASRALLPAALMVGAFLWLARLLLTESGYEPRSSVVALGMVMLLGLGRWLHRGLEPGA